MGEATIHLPDLIKAVGWAIELIGILLIFAVLLERKEPSSTALWALILIFFPGVGAILFLMFGRERVRVPIRAKLHADKLLAEKTAPISSRREGDLASVREPSVLGDIFRVGSALSGAEPTHGNRVDLLVDGDATYAALEEAIRSAKHHIFAEYYLLRADGTTDWFLGLLTEAARRGVMVKLLVDGYGSFWLSRFRLRALREAGGEVDFFLPARLILLQPMNLRNHRKILIVDGKVAFTGGINIGDEYRGTKAPWRDMHLKIQGPSVLPLALVLAQDVSFAARRGIPLKEIERARTSFCEESPPGSATVAILRSGPDARGPERETVHRVLFSAITSAKKSVFITTPYFIPDRSIVVALQTAAYRGVDVRILFPSRSNHPFVAQAGRSFYEDLLSAGVSIFEYGPGMIHAKTMVVDETVALVGSANMDLRSFRLNFEVHTVIDEPSVAERLVACFEADLSVSNRIDFEAFRARPLHRKIIEAAARLLSPLM